MIKQSRRFFIGTSLLALRSTASFSAPSAGGTLIHHVFFWLKNPSSKEDLIKLVEGIRTLQKIETVREFRIGQPAKTPKRNVIDDSYAVSLYTLFDDVDAHNVYQEHPIHKKFIEGYSSLWSKVQVYDSTDIS